jgi:hypothetical protein
LEKTLKTLKSEFTNVKYILFNSEESEQFKDENTEIFRGGFAGSFKEYIKKSNGRENDYKKEFFGNFLSKKEVSEIKDIVDNVISTGIILGMERKIKFINSNVVINKKGFTSMVNTFKGIFNTKKKKKGKINK